MPHRVFVIEDQIEAAAIEAAFAHDAVEHWDDRMRLELIGVAQNETDAYEQLAAHGATAGLPDAIVIDDYLPDGARATSRMVPIMRWLHDRAVEQEIPIARRPRTVLWSSCEPNMVYTFCALGGLQYQSKKDVDGLRIPVSAIWRALAGLRWRPTPYPSERDLTLEMREALPYLAHGWTQKRTALELGLGERGLSGFVARIKDLSGTPGPMSPDHPVNDVGALRIVARRGWVWIPYDLYEQLPAGLPLPKVIDPAVHREDLPSRTHVPNRYRVR